MIFDYSQSDFMRRVDRLIGLEEIDQLRRAFANVLTRRRLRKHWSQVDLGGYCGLEHSYVSRLEKGSRTPSLDVMMRVARAFQIAPERLMREVRIEFEGLNR